MNASTSSIQSSVLRADCCALHLGSRLTMACPCPAAFALIPDDDDEDLLVKAKENRSKKLKVRRCTTLYTHASCHARTQFPFRFRVPHQCRSRLASPYYCVCDIRCFVHDTASTKGFTSHVDHASMAECMSRQQQVQWQQAPLSTKPKYRQLLHRRVCEVHRCRGHYRACRQV